jgi:hypothetical protein
MADEYRKCYKPDCRRKVKEGAAPLAGIGHFFVLLDVELDRVVKSWVRQGSPISLAQVNVDDVSGEHRIAVAITVPGPR